MSEPKDIVTETPRLPPQAINAERAVLGRCLSNPDAVAAVRAVVQPADFYGTAHRTIFEAINRLYEAGEPLNIVAVAEALNSKLALVGGIAALQELSVVADTLPSVAAAHARRIMEYARRRALIALCDEISTSAYNASADLENSRQALLQAFPAQGLPPILPATAPDDPEPPQIIQGVLHAGSKLVYGGPSKSFKSWVLYDLCLAVASGTPWHGFPTMQGRALYVNLEIAKAFADFRKRSLCVAKNISIPDGLDVWNLRGHRASIDQLIGYVRNRGYSLIVLDPIYKLLAGRDENAAGDIGELCNEIESLAVQTGAAVAYGAHFAKGSASAKEHLDRVSGSGVWARDPDAFVTATPHEQEGAFTVEMTLRNFPPQLPFVVRWNFPRFARDIILDPAALKQPRGRKESYSGDDALKHLTRPMNTTEWAKTVCSETGTSKRTFFNRLRELEKAGRVTQVDSQWQIVDAKKPTYNEDGDAW